MSRFKKLLTPPNLCLLLILLVSGGLRFYRLADMANFDFDQEYASNFAYSVLKIYPIQLIGQGLSVDGLFMGPWYFYFLVPFFWLTHLHPIGGFIGSITLGLITICIYYWVSKQLFGTTAGLIAAFLRGFLFTYINNDWTMVPAYSSDLLIVVTWYLFYQYWHGKTKLFPLLGLVFGLYSSIHPIQFPFYLIFVGLIIIRRKLPSIKIGLLSIIGFILPNATLLLFEIIRHFFEVKRLLSLFTTPSTTPKASTDLIHNLVTVFSMPTQILNLNWLPWWLVTIGLVGFWGILTTRKIDFWKDRFHLSAIFLSFVIIILYYAKFPTHVPEYYYQGLTTLFVLYIAATLSLLRKSKLMIIGLSLLIVNISYASTQELIARWNNPGLSTLGYKDTIVKEVLHRQGSDNNFYVSFITELGWDMGYKYLFKLYNHNLDGRTADHSTVYTIVTPRSMSPDSIDITAGNIGLILPD